MGGHENGEENSEQAKIFGLTRPEQAVQLSLPLRQIAKDCWVAGQIGVADLAPLQALGFKAIINNRPDHEASGQPTHAELLAHAQRLGLEMHHLPLAAGTAPTAILLDQFKTVFDTVPKPVLAFCRSGTRSTSIYVAACGENHDLD